MSPPEFAAPRQRHSPQAGRGDAPNPAGLKWTSSDNCTLPLRLPARSWQKSLPSPARLADRQKAPEGVAHTRGFGKRRKLLSKNAAAGKKTYTTGPEIHPPDRHRSDRESCPPNKEGKPL